MKTTGMRSQTLTMQSDIVTNTVLKMPYESKTNPDGMIKSRTAMSFENLVRTLPIGVESKKTILARTIVSDIFLCMFEVLLMIRLKMVNSLITAVVKATAIKMPIILG